FPDQLGGAQDRLFGQARRNFAREAHFHASRDQRFDHHVDVSRSASRERRDRVHHLFFHKGHRSDRPKDAFYQLAMGSSGGVRGARRSALLHHHRNVRHGAKDGHAAVDQLLDQDDGDRGGQRDQNLVLAQEFPNLFQNVRQGDGLDR